MGEEETAEELGARLARMGADALVETLLKIFIPPLPQNSSLATTCPKISREDGRVDWARPAAVLRRRDRAFTPWPGLFTFRRNVRFKLSGLSPVSRDAFGAREGTESQPVHLVADQLLCI